MPSRSAHSTPLERRLSASVKMVATEKWCIVEATASDGAAAPIARVTWIASSGVAPEPE